MRNGWNLFKEMDSLRRDLDRALEQFFPAGDFLAPFRVAFLPGRAARAYPLVNLYEDEDALYYEALAPGLDPKSIEVAIRRGTLTVSGEKPAPAGVKDEAYHRSERAAGKFVRTIELPCDVEDDKVAASYEGGILSIRLPKAASAKPRQIPVSVN